LENSGGDRGIDSELPEAILHPFGAPPFGRHPNCVAI